MNFIFKRKIQRVFLFVSVCLFAAFFEAQGQETIIVKGKVVDGTTQKPIAAASVSTKEKTRGTVTDIDGAFSLTLQPNAVLTISSIGYKTQEVNVQSQSELLISLEVSAENLGEVVVIGYGQVKKGDATGSLATLKPDAMNKGLQVTPQDALVGKIAGVNIVPGSGAPGSEGTIRIRMGASLSASNQGKRI